MNKINEILNKLNKIICKVKFLSGRVTWIENNCCNGGGGSGIQSIQDGNGTDIDNTDSNNPIINILEVSDSKKGIVNNTPLQELGGVDKLINGVRIGRGSGNNEDNVIVGKDALSTNTTGTYNTAFGGWVLTENTTGSFNSSFGSGALYSNTTGMYNNAFGTSTLQNNTTGSRNIGVGTSLFWNSTGQENTGVGSNAGYGATTGSQNTYIGNQAGYNNGIGSYNTAIGSRAMITSGTGIPASTLDMNRNVFIGVGLTLVDGVNDVLAIDNKGATNTFYSNALLYGNFADRFLRINGRFEIAPSTMPVADSTYTKKLVWNPTTGVVAETDDTGGSTPTLLEVLTQDNDAEDKTIKFSYDDGGIPKTAEIGFLQPLGSLRKIPAFGTPNIYVTPSGFYSNSLYGGFNAGIVTDFDNDSNNFSIDTNQPLSKGITANQYFGANYDDNTYVQKYYVDEQIKKTTISDWSVDITYDKGVVVSHNGGIWRSEVDVNEDEPFESTLNKEGYRLVIKNAFPSTISPPIEIGDEVRIRNSGLEGLLLANQQYTNTSQLNPLDAEELYNNYFGVITNNPDTFCGDVEKPVDFLVYKTTSIHDNTASLTCLNWTLLAQVNEGGGSTPTLSEVLAEGNTTDQSIEFEYNSNWTTKIDKGQFLGGQDLVAISAENQNYRIELSPSSMVALDKTEGYISVFQNGGTNFNVVSTNPQFMGLHGDDYFGANYTNNTYIQKKYVDDNLLTKQPLDATLTALAGLTTSANQMIYATASDTFSTVNTTSGGRALLNSTGTANTIPYFSSANTVGAITTSVGGRALLNNAGTANTFPYYSASNTVSLGSITAFGRSLIDDTDATAAKTTLGLHAVATSGNYNDLSNKPTQFDAQAYFEAVAGYDAGETQILKHVNGVLTWVTD